MAKSVWRQEVALEYAKLHELDFDEDIEDRDLEKLNLDYVNSVYAELKKNKKIKLTDAYICPDCEHHVLEEDTFCPCCGADVTENDDGGFDVYKEDEPEEKSTSKKTRKKKVKVEEDSEPESEPKPEDPEEKPASKKRGRKKKVEKEETALATEEDSMSLKDRIEKIRQLNSETGINAHSIGKELFAIHQDKSYIQGGHESFAVFCDVEIGYTKSSAMSFIRIFQNFSEDQAGQLGVVKCSVLANAPDKLKNRLLKEGKDGKISAAKFSTREVQAKVKEERQKEREKAGEAPESTRGRPKTSKLKSFIGVKGSARWDSDDELIFDIDGIVGMEVKQLKAGLKFEFVELEIEDEGKSEEGEEGEE